MAVLILTVFISGCVEQNGGNEVTPTYNDNALNMEVKIQEKVENRRILPGSTMRMVVTLTNQVENATNGVDLKITNPYGIQISKVDCGSNCVCLWGQTENPCDSSPGVSCSFNGCHYDSIQSLDMKEITFGLKVPGEEEISSLGRDLKPNIIVKYNYSGTSALYIPIYRYGEKPVEPKKESPPPTKGPIHVSIDSDDWVRSGDLFPIYVNVKDVVQSSEKLMIYNDSFEMFICNAQKEGMGRCDFIGPINDYYYQPKENITLPLSNPLVCTLKANPIEVPMVKASIVIDYSYTYKVEKIETIRVEKAFLGIF